MSQSASVCEDLFEQEWNGELSSRPASHRDERDEKQSSFGIDQRREVTSALLFLLHVFAGGGGDALLGAVEEKCV